MRAMPSTAVKAHNRSAMAQYLYGHSHVTKQELERELGLSLPTITQNLHALEDDGLIRKGELQDSTGGRKAQNYEFNPDHRTAIGVVMRSNELRLCAINLYGNVIEKRNDALPYRNTNVYYQRIGGIINNFAADVEKKHGKVLGVSFAIQGILSPDATTIIFGTIMGNTGLTLETISQSVHYPCMMIHDSDASAMAELWFDSTLTDAVCVYLERRPGGAVIAGGKLYQGPNQCNGAIEHMTLVPGGRDATAASAVAWTPTARRRPCPRITKAFPASSACLSRANGIIASAWMSGWITWRRPSSTRDPSSRAT